MHIKPTLFSNLNREERIEYSTQTTYDLIIIGGGITGAGILLDAALRGINALLVEKEDFASGTSSKSTKLIHGGLRYLKQLEFGLVKESGTERTIVHNMACHLVHPNRMILPIVEKGTFGKLSASMAITMYERLARVPSHQRRSSVNKSELLKMEPALREDRIKSGIIYSEYRTDDARLTLETIKAAVRNKVEAFNYMEVESFVEENGKTKGVLCKDHVTGKSVTLQAKLIVNATGPWVDIVRKKENPDVSSNLHLSKGVHLVIDKKDLPVNNATYFDAFDGRMVFAIPRNNCIYVGTTDTSYYDNPDLPNCTLEDADYILKAINNFYKVDLTYAHIKSTWAGLRPLIQQEGKAPTELSRKDEIFISDKGLVSIAGGKLTGFRKMAERIVDLVLEKLRKEHKPCLTKNYLIHHNPFHKYQKYISYTKSLIEKYEGVVSKNQIVELTSNYGNDSSLLLENCDPSDAESLLHSILDYNLKYESVYHPLDVLDRRNGWLFFDMDKTKTVMEQVTQKLAEELDASKKEQWLLDCKKEISVHDLSALTSTS